MCYARETTDVLLNQLFTGDTDSDNDLLRNE